MRTTNEVISKLERLLYENAKRTFANDERSVFSADDEINSIREDAACEETHKLLSKILRFMHEK